jgi:tripartite-type tricarboxylate transporter receptor subunit TctC
MRTGPRLEAGIRRILPAALALAALSCGSLYAQNPAYPTRAVRMVVPFAAGGNLDANGRILAQLLSDTFGRQFFIDNRPGASGIIGSDHVSKSAPDGYTLLFAPAGNHTTNPSLFAKLPYDTVRDFTPISNFTRVPLIVVVHPSLPVRSTKELLALAKARPGEIIAANGGSGTSGHLATELFMSISGARFTQVPYKGNAPGLADTVAGQTSMMIDTLSTSLPQVKGGRLRPLAVTSRERTPLLPNVPTVHESAVPGFEADVYNGTLGPPGLPKEIVAKLAAEMIRLAREPAVRDRYAQSAVEVLGSTPEEFGAFIRKDIEKWAKVIRGAGIKAQ